MFRSVTLDISLLIQRCNLGYESREISFIFQLKWIYWINPFAYGYKALFANEMKGLVFECGTKGSVPQGPGYNNTAFQTCILAGSIPGELSVRGEDYINAAYGIDSNDLAISAVATLLLFILFATINIIGNEFINHSKGGFIRKVYKGGNAPKTNTKEEELKQNDIVSEAQKHLETLLTSQVLF